MDFGVNLLSATSVDGDDYAPFFFPTSQIIEVQPCEMNGQGGRAPVSTCAAAVPEPLTFPSSALALCVVAMAALRRLRSTY
jgi:hypothetical protein